VPCLEVFGGLVVLLVVFSPHPDEGPEEESFEAHEAEADEDFELPVGEVFDEVEEGFVFHGASLLGDEGEDDEADDSDGEECVDVFVGSGDDVVDDCDHAHVFSPWHPPHT